MKAFFSILSSLHSVTGFAHMTRKLQLTPLGANSCISCRKKCVKKDQLFCQSPYLHEMIPFRTAENSTWWIAVDNSVVSTCSCTDCTLQTFVTSCSSDSKGDLGGACPPVFWLAPCLAPPSFVLNFTLKFVWLTYTADNFHPEKF